jgi:hypothetical protein
MSLYMPDMCRTRLQRWLKDDRRKDTEEELIREIVTEQVFKRYPLTETKTA